MKNNQKGFANVVLIGVIIILLSIASYFTWSKKIITKIPLQKTNGEFFFRGELIDGGVECQLFQDEDGKQYTLIGNLTGFKKGDVVNIKGTLPETSYCQQGYGTISVSTIKFTK